MIDNNFTSPRRITMRKLNITKVRKVMTDKKINQTKLAEDIGVDQSSITGWFNGRSNPSQDNIEKLAEYLRSVFGGNNCRE